MKINLIKGVRFFTGRNGAYIKMLNPYTQNIVRMDETGNVIFGLLQEMGDFDEVLSSLCEKYPDEDPAEVGSVLHDVIKNLESHNIIEVAE